MKGAQTDGFVAKSKEQITVNRYTPRQHKGAEYVHEFKAKEEAKYLEVTFIIQILVKYSF